MLPVLLKTMFRTLFANFRHGRLLKNKRSLFAIVALAVLPVLIILQTTNMFYNWLLMPNVGETFLLRFVSASLLGLVMLLLLTGLPNVMHQFFLAPDLPLLLTMPIEKRDIFSLKFLHATINNCGLYIAIGLPLLVSLAIAMGASPVVYIVIVIGSLFFIVLPTGLASLVAFSLARLFSIKRMRRVSTFVLGLFLILLWAGFQFLRLSRLNPVAGEYDPNTVSRAETVLTKIHAVPLPSDWLISAVHSAHIGHWRSTVMNLLLLASFAILLLGLVVFWRIRLQHVRIDGRMRHREKHRALSRSGTASSAVKALILKDTRLIMRDTRFFQSAFLLMTMLLLVPFLAGSDVAVSQETLAFFIPYIPVTILSLIVSSTLARQSLPMERLAFFWLLQSPTAVESILLAKLLRVVGWVAPIALIAVVITALKNGRADYLPAMMFLHIGCVVCGASLGLASAAFTTHFNWTDPRYMATPIGTYASTFLTLLIGAVGPGVLAIGFFMGQQIVAFLLFFIYVFFVFWLCRRAAKVRLTKLDWIY